jgi:hypothetical protein
MVIREILPLAVEVVEAMEQVLVLALQAVRV